MTRSSVEAEVAEGERRFGEHVLAVFITLDGHHLLVAARGFQRVSLRRNEQLGVDATTGIEMLAPGR